MTEGGNSMAYTGERRERRRRHGRAVLRTFAAMVFTAVFFTAGAASAFAGEVRGRGHSSSEITSLSEYALSVCSLTPHPEWDAYVKDCFDSYQSLPDSAGPAFLTVRRTRDADEILRISHYVNNEFGFARGCYVTAFQLTGGGCTLGFDRVRGRSGVLKSFRFEAESMKQKAAELKGGTETETMENIFCWVQENFPQAEIAEGADPRDYYYGWFSGHDQNCNGRAKIISMMCRMNGVNAQVVFGTYAGTDHAWTEVYADGCLWYCDASLQGQPLTGLPESYVREQGWPELAVR